MHSAVLLDLIQQALNLRAKRSDETHQNKAFDELKEECATLQIVNAVKLLADLYRMNYDPHKSKYGDIANDTETALALIKNEAKVFVQKRLKVQTR